MKTATCLTTFLLSCHLGVAQENPIILNIRDNFQKWQPIIEIELSNSMQLYHYVWGNNYQNDKWYTNKKDTSDKFLYQKVSLLEKSNLGTFVYYDNYSISGDWYISVDYYFDTKDKLYFIFWRMNTFQAAEPLTIEKRLYFDTNGNLIRDLKSTYKMNTKEESTAGFADRDVEYQLQLNKMEFYEAWKAN